MPYRIVFRNNAISAALNNPIRQAPLFNQTVPIGTILWIVLFNYYAGKARTALKGSRMKRDCAAWNCNICKATATCKCILINFCNSTWNYNGFELLAVKKCVTSNEGYATWHFDICKGGMTECIRANIRNAVWQFYACKA